MELLNLAKNSLILCLSGFSIISVKLCMANFLRSTFLEDSFAVAVISSMGHSMKEPYFTEFPIPSSEWLIFIS